MKFSSAIYTELKVIKNIILRLKEYSIHACMCKMDYKKCQSIQNLKTYTIISDLIFCTLYIPHPLREIKNKWPIKSQSTERLNWSTSLNSELILRLHFSNSSSAFDGFFVLGFLRAFSMDFKISSDDTSFSSGSGSGRGFLT